MTDAQKVQKAADIMRANGIQGLGKCRAYISETNKNEVEILVDGYGLYCIVNVRSGKIIDC